MEGRNTSTNTFLPGVVKEHLLVGLFSVVSSKAFGVRAQLGLLEATWSASGSFHLQRVSSRSRPRTG